MIKIKGYKVNEQLYNGSRTLVYRAVRDLDEKPVVMKLLKNPYPNFNELLHFRNQYTIAKIFIFPVLFVLIVWNHTKMVIFWLWKILVGFRCMYI